VNGRSLVGGEDAARRGGMAGVKPVCNAYGHLRQIGGGI
jgi:hypothetical protein